MSDVAKLHEAEELLSGVQVRRNRLSPYETYRKSDVEWISRVPSHWKTWKVTHGFQRLSSGTTPNTGDRSYYDGDVPWVTTSELRETVINDTSNKLTEKALRDHSTLRLYPAGTLLFAMYGATIGRMGILGISAAVNQACSAFVGPLTLDPRFTFYWLWMRRPTLIALSSGGGQPNLSQDDLRRIRIPAPPLDEQRSIVAFLDRETTKIDSLVAKKRRMIELLAEKRTALISHAVTQGINPDAAMKPSGIDWLGDVPAHWNFHKLGFMVRMRGGATPSKGNDAYWKGAIPWVSPKDMKTREIADTEDHISEAALAESSLTLFDPPVVLMVVRGMILAHTFPVAITTAPVTVNQDIKALIPRIQCSEEYLLNLLTGLSLVVLGTVDDSAHGTKVLRLPVWKHVGVYLPDDAEQVAICDYVRTTLQQFDGLIRKVESAITRLVEYRSALISAAVTGQIDVRATAGEEAAA